MAKADQDETYACRVEGCNRTFESRRGIGQHHGRTHDFEKLLKQDLQRIADELGRTPTKKEIYDRDDAASADAYQNKFGSWNNAIEAVGLEPNQFQVETSRVELKEKLQRIADELGRTPTAEVIRSRNDCASEAAYKREFGSWNDALKAAGLEMNQVRFEKSRAELKEDLLRIANELGRTPTMEDINSRDNCASDKPYRREFGSWNKALKAAGLSVNIDRSARPDLPYAKSSTKWTKISQSIRQRDDFHCQCCGVAQEEIGRALSIHHITPRRSFKHIETPDRFDRQNNPQNIISLCPSCHKSVEGKFQGTDPETFAHKAREYLGYTDENELVQSLTSPATASSSVAAD